MPHAERTVDIDVIPQAAVPHFEAPLFPRLRTVQPVRAHDAQHRDPRQDAARCRFTFSARRGSGR
ncbi:MULTISPECIES: hypothetical protein [Pandoraea]|uniref:hypothetical protein n=1 Tax=Pandoraea TaxID=93217 RepID=UPI0008477EDE|nr:MULTISPECIES: hypothetical protein [Pandoraea]MCI3205700.1 hypothetical protein [Pandoraea sp. LA3]MDN4583728.1 hypothetical protein [Pandoraea capi]ODP33982.1 hypothetical protein A9762_02590 [Pandoraea sp. ISTKB]